MISLDAIARRVGFGKILPWLENTNLDETLTLYIYGPFPLWSHLWLLSLFLKDKNLFLPPKPLSASPNRLLQFLHLRITSPNRLLNRNVLEFTGLDVSEDLIDHYLFLFRVFVGPGGHPKTMEVDIAEDK